MHLHFSDGRKHCGSGWVWLRWGQALSSLFPLEFILIPEHTFTIKPDPNSASLEMLQRLEDSITEKKGYS
jgi:hypothetical protein